MSGKPLVGTVADLTRDGVTRVHIWCYNPACHHSGDLSTTGFGPDLPLQQLRERLCCSKCGGRAVGMQADWSQYQRALKAGRLVLNWRGGRCHYGGQPNQHTSLITEQPVNQYPVELPPYTENPALAQQMVFLGEVGRLRDILRQTLVSAEKRQENDAEHSWHVTLMALVLAQHAREPLDILRVIKMLLIHDVVEIDAGDTFIYDEVAKATQPARERAAADRIFALLPRQQAADLRAVWEEFEAAESPEARFAKAIDRLQPLMLNYAAAGGGWRRHGITADRVRTINSVIDQGAPDLWAYAQKLIDDAVKRGFLTEPAVTE